MLAVLDARRGEVFAAIWQRRASALLAPPRRWPRRGWPTLAERPGTPLAIGDGAVEFRAVLERSGALDPGGPRELHRVTAINHCRPRPRRCAPVRPTRSCPSTCGFPTPRSPAAPSQADDHRARHHDPPAALLRSPAGDRDRAPRVPDAVVAGDVRARALEAVRASAWRAVESERLVGYLICSRYDQVWHLMNIAVDPTRAPARARQRAARGDDRARRRRTRRTRSRCGPRTPARSRCTSGSASAPPEPGGATTRTPARTR